MSGRQPGRPLHTADFGDQEVTTLELGSVLGIGDSNVRALVRSKTFKARREGKNKPHLLKLGETVRSYINYRINQANPESKNSPDLESARLRKLNAEAQEKELRVQLIKGKLHRSEDVEACVNDMNTQVRSTLINLSVRICRVVAGKDNPLEIRQAVDKEVAPAFNALRDYFASDYYARNPQQPLLPDEVPEEEDEQESEQ